MAGIGRAAWSGRLVEWSGFCGFVFLISAAAVAQTPPRASEQRSQGGPSTNEVIATGCLREVSEVGGQGGGGAAWQGGIAGHVLADVQIVPTGTPAPKPAAPVSASGSSQATANPLPSLLLVRGIPESQLRTFRGQQVELRGVVGPAREMSRGAAAPKGNEGAGAPSTPNGRVAGERGAPAVGTGGSLRVPPSASSGAGVTQVPPEFHATSVRGISRTCPAATR
jgi:hypothetical protein